MGRARTDLGFSRPMLTIAVSVKAGMHTVMSTPVPMSSSLRALARERTPALGTA